MEKQKKTAVKNKYVLWYALCFAFLGLIDQRRGSAPGAVQMAMANLTGPVLACMLLPSMKKAFLRTRYFFIWLGICGVGIPVGVLVGIRIWWYEGQWNTGVANAAIGGVLILYMIWDRRRLRQNNRLKMSCFFSVAGMLLLMQLSVHGGLWPLWFLVFFGAFYLIGIPERLEESFILGMLWGFILWFFVQQILAFLYRPYDYVRYKGMYTGETQNGLFYMVAFCAFTGMWLWLRHRGGNRLLQWLCFLLSAGSLSFLLLTGGRASLVGAAAAAGLAYVLYDIFLVKSFRHWLFQGIGLVLCAGALFPAAYGCARYIPAYVHKPMWFEVEIDLSGRVMPEDPWNSEKYVSFDEALETNLGRVLQMFGIRLDARGGEARLETPFSLRAFAAEGEPGSSPDNPFYIEDTDYESSISVRRTIYYYYATHLNLQGHRKEDGGFYMTDGSYMYHAHNMFLQFAYDYGILPGMIFLGWSVVCLVRLVLRRDLPGIICASFLAAVMVYGCTEMAVTTGQITLALLFILYYFGMQKGRVSRN